jgi:UDP-GlcNAc:undecaprenyl-phosphate GlcNAc-1-phosphate transferase
MINIIIYIVITFLIFMFISKLSYVFGFVDFPNKRKSHLFPVAYTGGVSLCLIFLFSTFLFKSLNEIFYLIILISIFISLVGLIDDKYNLNVISKLSLQIIPITFLIIKENLILNDIGYYQYFTIFLGPFSYFFSLLCVLFLINSFNYFDGIDGTLSFTVISVFLILLFLNSNSNFELFLIIVFVPITIFLFFNFSIFKLPKLFLGDSGSLLLGFVVSFLLIYLSKSNDVHPVLLAWSIVIFVYEFLSINIIRLIGKKNIFKPGKDHLHHELFFRFSSIFLTNLTIFALNIILFTIGYLSWLFVSPLSSLILFIFLFIIFFIIRNKFKLNL